MSQWLWHKWGKERQPGILGSSFAVTALVFRSRTKGFALPLLVFIFCHLNWWSFTRFHLHSGRHVLPVCFAQETERCSATAVSIVLLGLPSPWFCPCKGIHVWGVLPCGIVLSPVCFCFPKDVCKMWLLDICGRLNWLLYIFQAFFIFLFRKPLVIKPRVA